MALAAGFGMLFRRAAPGTAGRAARVASAGAALLVTAAALLVAVVLVAQVAGLARFRRVELVGVARSMGGAAAFCGDFTLLVRIHRCEPAVIATPAGLLAGAAFIASIAIILI